jgi:hypothetical protein
MFEGTEGIGSHIHVLRSRTCFRRYRGRRVPFSCFALPESFSAVPGRRLPFSCFARPYSFSIVPRALGPVFKFCAHGLVFGGTEGVGSHIHVLRSRTRFRLYRGRRFPFSCFALLDSFSTVPRASVPFFMFCAPRLVFDGTKGVGSRFPILRAQTRVWRYRVRRIPFSCFARPDSFSVVSGASFPVFMFCADKLVFGSAECVESRCRVLHVRTRFRRYRGRRVPYSCFAHLDSFSAVPRASGPIFMFCAPGLIFGGIGDVRSLLLVLPSGTRFRRY